MSLGKQLNHRSPWVRVKRLTNFLRLAAVGNARSHTWFNESGFHDDVIKWKRILRYWPFVWGIHQSSANSLHKGQWRGALMFSLISTRTNGWVNNREAGDLRRHRAHHDVIVMVILHTLHLSASAARLIIDHDYVTSNHCITVSKTSCKFYTNWNLHFNQT